MSRVNIKMKDLPDATRRLGKSLRHAILKGARECALKLLREIQVTAEDERIDDGPYRQGFRIEGDAHTGNLTVVNDVYHAALVEFGRRPGPVSAEGIDKITAWVEKKGMGSGTEARRIAFAVANKIREHGFKPRFIVTRSIKTAKPRMVAAMKRAIASAS